MLNFLYKYFATPLKGNFMPYKILAFLIIIASAVFYFNYSQNQIKTLSMEIAKYEITNETNNSTIASLRANASEQQRMNTQLQIKLKQSEKSNDELRALLRKHNLKMLSLKKPNLIEKRINNATKRVFEDITNITTD